MEKMPPTVENSGEDRIEQIKQLENSIDELISKIALEIVEKPQTMSIESDIRRLGDPKILGKDGEIHNLREKFGYDSSSELMSAYESIDPDLKIFRENKFKEWCNRARYIGLNDKLSQAVSVRVFLQNELDNTEITKEKKEYLEQSFLGGDLRNLEDQTLELFKLESENQEESRNTLETLIQGINSGKFSTDAENTLYDLLREKYIDNTDLMRQMEHYNLSALIIHSNDQHIKEKSWDALKYIIEIKNGNLFDVNQDVNFTEFLYKLVKKSNSSQIQKEVATILESHINTIENTLEDKNWIKPSDNIHDLKDILEKQHLEDEEKKDLLDLIEEMMVKDEWLELSYKTVYSAEAKDENTYNYCNKLPFIWAKANNVDIENMQSEERKNFFEYFNAIGYNLFKMELKNINEPDLKN